MKKMNLLAFTTAAFLVLHAPASFAQSPAPLFEIQAGNAVTNAKFLLQTASGELLSATDMKLMAIDPLKQSVMWESNDFPGLEEADISMIEGTPFFKIERQKMTSIAKNKSTYILKANTGEIVYDSKGEGIKVRNTLIVPGTGGLLMEVVKDGFLSVSFLDFKTVKEAWTVPLAKEKSGGIGIGALKRAIKSYMSTTFNVTPMADADGTIILVYKKEIFAISKSGAVLWKKELDENVDDAYMATDKKSIFIGYRKYIDKLNTSTGNSLLKEPIKMRDELNGITPIENGYVVYNKAGINIMDADGNMKWKKDCKLGDIADVRYTSKGILGIQSAKEDETVLYWAGLDGERGWTQELKGGFMLVEPTDKGIMYVTTERANTLTYEKGKDVWNKDIKLKGKPNFGIDSKNKILYAYAGEKLHAFNFSDNSYKMVTESLPFKKFNEEEEQLKFDFRDGGANIVINSSQNVASVQAADGKINYNNYFKDIGNTRKKWGKALGFAAGAVGAGMNMNSLAKGDVTVYQATDEYGKPIENSYVVDPNNPAADGLGAAGSDLYAAASKRYRASQATKDNLYIPSEMPEGNGLLVWSKAKGEIAKKILFTDVTPVFVVDEATDRIYIMVRNTLKAYDLK